MKYLEELKDMLCEELEKIGKKGELSAGSLETVHKLTDTIKNLGKIEMLEEQSGGYSEAGGNSYARGRGRNAKRDSMGRYSREGGYSEEMSINEGGMNYEGNSYAQGGRGGNQGGNQGGNRGGGSRGGNRGGGSSYARGGYSRDGAKDYMMEQLEEMMEQAENPKEREALKRCMMAIENA